MRYGLYCFRKLPLPRLFVGYNGSGKTVLFKSICRFLTIDSGSIQIDNKILGKEITIINDAGIIIEEPAFLKNKSAYQNLDLLYRLNNPGNKQHLFSVIRQVGLDPYSRKQVSKFSLGMKQRLALAQATMENQSVLILDEPMNGLDKNGVHDMRKWFLHLKKEGKLILLASHNREDIQILCDEVYELDNGTLTQIK